MQTEVHYLDGESKSYLLWANIWKRPWSKSDVEQGFEKMMYIVNISNWNSISHQLY